MSWGELSAEHIQMHAHMHHEPLRSSEKVKILGSMALSNGLWERWMDDFSWQGLGRKWGNHDPTDGAL